jgi:glycosyltransferase involved in cell wall biosynthesis
MSRKPIIYLEAMVFAPEHMSGIGHATLEIAKELMKQQKTSGAFTLRLIVPFNKVNSVLAKFEDDKPEIKKLWLLPRMIELLMRINLLPPVDLFIGKGVYVFPNYRNWPVRRSKSQSITYVHDVSFKLHPEFVSPKNRNYLNKYVQRWMKRTDRVITLAEQVRSEILANYQVPENKIVVIYDGVDTGSFKRKDTGEIERVKNKYSLNANKYVLFVGNKEPRKNLQRLIRAFTKLDPDLKNEYALILVGAGSWLSEGIDNAVLEARANGVQVLFPDRFVDDVDLPALYSGAKLFAFVPIYEGFGIPPLEALACGTSVLASDIPVLREVLKDEVEYCNPEDEQSITDGLRIGLRKHQPIYLNTKFLDQYSWKNSATELLSVVTNLD